MRNLWFAAVAALLAACGTMHADFDVGLGNGIDKERLARIDHAIAEDIDAGRIAGAVALVARDGRIVYQKSFGYADLDSQTPMRTDSIFRIASMSKAITSVGVMLLYERGFFQLSDPVSKFIPAFANPRVAVSFGADGEVTETRPAKGEIRIVDLLSHSSGIGYPFIPQPLQASYRKAGIIDGVTASDMRLADQVALLAAQPLLFDPGTAFAYGLSTDVLGYLIEVLSGKPLDQFFGDEIFAPLGMTDTFFYLPADKAERLATVYADVDGELRRAQGDEGIFHYDNPRFPVDGARSYFSGGAGLSSTAHDYFRFMEMLRKEGELDGTRLLSRKAVELMRTPRIDWDDDGLADFGLGFQVVSDLGKSGELGSVGAYGWDGIFNTKFWIDPQERLVAVFMSQAFPYAGNLPGRFRTLVYQALE